MLERTRRLIPNRLRSAVRESLGSRFYAVRSYAQEGEDIVLLRLLDGLRDGVYVDVGAHHPFRFSNTQLFHERGWRGINIDARPGSMKAFARRRPRDINLEIGISLQPAQLEYHLFSEPALNTFDAALASLRRSEGWSERETRPIQCMPLAEVLDRELPKLGVRAVDLLSVDVEGLDLEVLRSNDWDRYRPRAVVAEVLRADLRAMLDSDLTRYLDSVGFRPHSKLVNSAIFLRTE